MNDPKQRFVLMLAIGLTFMLLMQYVIPQPERQQSAPAQTVARPIVPSGAPVSVETAEFEDGDDHLITVRVGKEGKNEHGYEATFSTRGAGLAEYRLLGYYRLPGNDEPDNRVILLDRMAAGRDSLRVDSMTSGSPSQSFRTMVLRETKYQLIEVPKGAEVKPEPAADVVLGDRLVFRAVVDDWEILRIYTFPTEGGELADFTMKFDLEWRNLSDVNRVLNYNLVGPAGLVADDDSANFGVINFLTARQPSSEGSVVEVERKRLGDLKDMTGMSAPDNRSKMAWIGAKNRFFTALMTTQPSALNNSDGAGRLMFAGDMAFLPPKGSDIWTNLAAQPMVAGAPGFEETQLMTNSGGVPAGGVYRASHLLYAGPAVDEWMEQADSRLNGVVSYTISYLDFISRWLVRLLTFLDGILGNYGLAIIAVTIIIKILLHPLSRKSFVSMNKMTKLAPQMKEIQRKYAGDKVKMQQEMSKFYKDNGVSMAGGCLPIFLQLPIFFALYGAFSQGFSMRHAAFIPGWIQDLSKPDSVYDLGTQIPLLSSSHISLLPILYLGLQFIQMSLQPKPSDPQQAQQQKMMKFMPLIFVFIFYSMPAGLVLYFTVSALAGVVENWWMRNILLPKLGLGDTPAAAVTAATGAAAGTGAAAVPSEAAKKKKRR